MFDLKKIAKSLGLSVLTVLLSVTVLYAATTIGSNITTAGTLTVDTTSTLTGAVTTGSTLTVAGLAQLNGVLQATSTSLFTDQATFYNNMKVAPAYGLDVSSAGVLNIGTTTATTINVGKTGVPVVMANASSTLANFGGGTTVSGISFGTCTVTIGSVAASSTAAVNCTATGVTTSHKVFVTPYITDSSIIFSSASSTANDVIQVAVHNTGWVAGIPGTAVDPADNVWSWFAVK